MSIDLIGSAVWRSPVFVRIGYGSSESVESASEALHYLIRRWPAERGEHYERALLECRRAADGLIPAEEAREAFTAAAIEAHIRA